MASVSDMCVIGVGGTEEMSMTSAWSLGAVDESRRVLQMCQQSSSEDVDVRTYHCDVLDVAGFRAEGQEEAVRARGRNDLMKDAISCCEC